MRAVALTVLLLATAANATFVYNTNAPRLVRCTSGCTSCATVNFTSASAAPCLAYSAFERRRVVTFGSTLCFTTQTYTATGCPASALSAGASWSLCNVCFSGLSSSSMRICANGQMTTRSYSDVNCTTVSSAGTAVPINGVCASFGSGSVKLSILACEHIQVRSYTDANCSTGMLMRSRYAGGIRNGVPICNSGRIAYDTATSLSDSSPAVVPAFIVVAALAIFATVL